MRVLFIFFTFVLSLLVRAQSEFPARLQGTWMMETEPVIEQWTLLGPTHLKGFSGIVGSHSPKIIEYLDIQQKDNQIILEAYVPGQHGNEAIYFKMERQGDSYRFVNKQHDFPQVISYTFLSEDKVTVELTGDAPGISYGMTRLPAEPGAKGPLLLEDAYDETLARRLGADEYGMKSYYFALIVTGENTTADSAFRAACFKGHFANMEKMLEEGKLVVAGPFGKNTDSYRGLFILQNTGTEAETYEYLQQDAAIKADILRVRIYPWYGSAALPEYLPIARKISLNR